MGEGEEEEAGEAGRRQVRVGGKREERSRWEGPEGGQEARTEEGGEGKRGARGKKGTRKSKDDGRTLVEMSRIDGVANERARGKAEEGGGGQRKRAREGDAG